jgi:hypothetical protein
MVILQRKNKTNVHDENYPYKYTLHAASSSLAIKGKRSEDFFLRRAYIQTQWSWSESFPQRE